MQISVEVQRGHSKSANGVGLVLVALGSVAIGTRQLGIMVTVALAVITVVVGFGGLRLWSAWWRRRAVSASEDELLLTAWASLGSDAGVLSVGIDALVWECGQYQVVYTEADIEQATIRPLPFVGAAKLRLAIRGGSEVLLTVTAPARAIELALATTG